MKRLLCSLLVATLPFGSVLADAPKSKNAKVTLVYQHELPNVPGKSIKGVLVEYGPGGYSPGHTHAKSAFIYATVLEGAIRSQVNDGPVTTYKVGQSFSELPGDRHGVSANASKTKAAKLLAVLVVDTYETELTIHGTDDPIRELRSRFRHSAAPWQGVRGRWDPGHTISPGVCSAMTWTSAATSSVLRCTIRRVVGPADVGRLPCTS